MTDKPPKNIYQRILAVMTDVEYIRKEAKKVNNQYTFVSHDAVTAKLHPRLVEHGIAVIPRVVRWGQEGNRTTADLEVDFINVDDPEDRVTVPCFGFGIDPQDKGPGKAVSYAYKYAMLKTFVLETGDDPERDSIDHEPEPEYTPKQYEEFHKILNDGDALAYVAFMEGLHPNVQAGLYNSFPQGKKVEGKKKADALNNSGHDLLAKYVDTLSEAAANNDTGMITETIGELTNDTAKQLVWLRLSAETRAGVKDAMKTVA